MIGALPRRSPMSLLRLSSVLLLSACVEKPDGPPPLPDQPPSVDTASFEAPVEEQVARGEGGNLPPKITALELTPTDPTASTDLRVVAQASDPEGGMATLRYAWVVNGRELPGEEGTRLAAARFRKGDHVRVRVSASDGLDTTVQDSAEVQVGNSPPQLITRPSDFRGQLDGFEVKASDPDGDRLSYRIEDGPPGLSVGPDGRVAYSGSEEGGGGTYNAKVVVEDPEGDFVALPLTFTVAAGKASERYLPGQGGK